MIHPTALRNTQSADFGTAVDGGSGAGVLKLRTGTSIGSGTLLATITFSDPSFGSPSTGVITGASFPKSATAAATGTVGHYVVEDSAGTTVGSGTNVGTSGAEVNLVSLSITSGQTVTVNSITYTIAAGS